MKNATKDVIKSYYGEGGRNVDDALTSSAGKKARVSLGSNGRKRGAKKSEFCSWTLFILPPRRRRRELQSCNNAAETDSRFLSSCNFAFRKDGNSAMDKVEARLRIPPNQNENIQKNSDLTD